MDTRPGAQVAHADLPYLSWALHSDVGAVREGNEDFVGAYAPAQPEDERGPLFVVADGMGGHLAGEVASRMAVEAAFGEWTSGAAAFPKQALRSAVVAANSAVFAASLDNEHRGMGTTIVALAVTGDEALIGHVGDSRCYLVRDGACSQLTADHSRVAEMLRARLITPEQAAHHPARSMLTRSLGQTPGVQVEITRSPLRADDRFVLCSDGLWDLVPRAEIARPVSGAMPHEAAAALVGTALERGAPDNVTVVVVHAKTVTAASAEAARPWWAFLKRGR